MMNECLTSLLQVNGSIDPWTAQPRIQVAETSPETIGESPYIGVEILNTSPLVRDSMTNWFRSDVMISVDTHQSLRSTQIMDNIQCIFIYPDENFQKPAHTYCCDISDGCIKGHFTQDWTRPRVGRQGSNTYSAMHNMWEELMILEAIWSPCPCDPDCEQEVINFCPIILPHSPNHPACQCPE